MEASFEMEVKLFIVKGAKRKQKYDSENKDQFEDDEDEENDLITTYAVECILIFILMNLIYQSKFNILKLFDIALV